MSDSLKDAHSRHSSNSLQPTEILPFLVRQDSVVCRNLIIAMTYIPFNSELFRLHEFVSFLVFLMLAFSFNLWWSDRMQGVISIFLYLFFVALKFKLLCFIPCIYFLYISFFSDTLLVSFHYLCFLLHLGSHLLFSLIFLALYFISINS